MRVLTVTAKGLEWRTVILPDLATEIGPARFGTVGLAPLAAEAGPERSGRPLISGTSAWKRVAC